MHTRQQLEQIPFDLSDEYNPDPVLRQIPDRGHHRRPGGGGALDTVSMALYNYFPSREALLAELANQVCKQFSMPRRKTKSWTQILRDWLSTLRDRGERYPMMFKITGVDGKTSAGWLRVSRIVSVTLYDAGFGDNDRALNIWLFYCQAIALVQAEVMGGFHSPISLSQLEEPEPGEQEHLLMPRPCPATSGSAPPT